MMDKMMGKKKVRAPMEQMIHDKMHNVKMEPMKKPPLVVMPKRGESTDDAVMRALRESGQLPKGSKGLYRRHKK